MSTYQLIERIGRGGMGDVFEARRILANGAWSRVACKSMNDELNEDPAYRDMFFREARINLDISHDHPGLVSVYECVEDADGRSHLIMELVDGCNLRALRDAHGPLAWDILRLVARDMLETLAYMHERGVMHRDISPCNILISCEGAIKLSDLGLAKDIGTAQTDPRIFRGKWAYSAPEAIQRKPLDARADLFAFAALLYELATTRCVYGDALNFADVESQLAEWRPPAIPDEVPLDLRTLIAGFLQAAPDHRRPATARQALPLLTPFDAEAARTRLADLARDIHERTRDKRKRRDHERANIVQRSIIVESRPRIDPHADTDQELGADVNQATGSLEPPCGNMQPERPPRKRRGLFAAALIVCALGWLGYERYGDDRTPTASPLPVEASIENAPGTVDDEPDRLATAEEKTPDPIERPEPQPDTVGDDTIVAVPKNEPENRNERPSSSVDITRRAGATQPPAVATTSRPQDGFSAYDARWPELMRR